MGRPRLGGDPASAGRRAAGGGTLPGQAPGADAVGGRHFCGRLDGRPLVGFPFGAGTGSGCGRNGRRIRWARACPGSGKHRFGDILTATGRGGRAPACCAAGRFPFGAGPCGGRDHFRGIRRDSAASGGCHPPAGGRRRTGPFSTCASGPCIRGGCAGLLTAKGGPYILEGTGGTGRVGRTDGAA